MKKFFYEYGQLNWLYVLFAANVIGFLMAYFAFMFSDGNSVLFFAIHSSDKWSLLKIWKLLTYTFTDHTVGGLIGNLIWLWIFGNALANIIGSKHIFRIYVLVTLLLGLLGGIFCLFLSGNKYPVLLLGFDLVTIALATACIYKIPHYKLNFMLIGSVPIWIIGVVFLLFKIFAFPDKTMALTLILSVMSAIIGFVYMATLKEDGHSFRQRGSNISFSSLFTDVTQRHTFSSFTLYSCE